MAKKTPQKPRQRADALEEAELPPGVKLVRKFEGHHLRVWSAVFDPQGGMLATGSGDRTVKLWDAHSGELLRTLEGFREQAFCVAFDPQGGLLATGSRDGTVNLWDARSGKLVRTLEEGHVSVYSVAFDPQGQILACSGVETGVRLWDVRSGKPIRILGQKSNSVAFDPQGLTLASSGDQGGDYSVNLWDVRNGTLSRTLDGHRSWINSVAFDPQGEMLATGSADYTVRLWEVRSGKLFRTLEGHTKDINAVAFSPDGHLLATKSNDQKIRLWSCETWETLAVIPALSDVDRGIAALAFHPTSPLLVSTSSPSSETICLWQLDLDALLGQRVKVAAAGRAVHHTTGKIVLVGDHSVGKSALGYRMVHGIFKEQASTHGQQFWVFPALGQQRADRTECEAILWDFAGQPDYRLVHALFVDNADLALVLFDASDLRDPLHGVGFWLKQLRAGQSRCPIILVAAQTDRGTCSLTQDELSAYCRNHGIKGPIATSSLTGLGFDELVECMKSLIPWDDKPATVTTATFKRIKDYVLGLKEAKSEQIIVTPQELRSRLEATDTAWRFSDAEVLTAVGHLENYGYVKRLRTTKGEQRVLLQPERLNNLASSFVLEARKNPRGLGALEEKRLLTGGYEFPELKHLNKIERDVLLDSAALLLLEHNVCSRETDPLRVETYLVFPELINLKVPFEEETAVEDGVAYTVSGATENVFASLVVLLGYTHTFTRTAQWQNNARYQVGDGLVCGFRQEAERDDELDFVLCFGVNVGLPVRALFQGLFESFLTRRNLTVMRFEPVRCAICGHLLDRSVARQRLKEGKAFAFCNDCGEKLSLPSIAAPIQLTRDVQTKVDSQRDAAERRTRFEEAVFRVRAFVAEQKITPPEAFISYAWGVAEHERWVERQLATDLQKGGITILLDRWHNAQIGASVARFIERIDNIDRIIMVGTPAYRRKYENKDSSAGNVVAAEVDLINNRLLGTEQQKQSVLPLLLEGDKADSLPPLLHGRVRADFRDELNYFVTAFDLILSLYELPPNHPAVADLRESLRGPELR